MAGNGEGSKEFKRREEQQGYRTREVGKEVFWQQTAGNKKS